jgi:hypothetical protein
MMKVRFVFICISITLFSGCNFPFNATPSLVINQDAVVKASPNNNAYELFKYNEKAVLGAHFMGVSSNKDKMVINGKEYNEYWYLIEVRFKRRNEIEGSKQGWVYGGDIKLTEDVIKPSFLPISERYLEKKDVFFTLCTTRYINGGEGFTQDNCVKGDGMIRFYPNNRFIRDVAKKSTIEYWTGTYSIEDNTLILAFEPQSVLVSYNQSGIGTQSNQTNRTKLIKKYGIHNALERPIFIALPNYEEEYTTWLSPSSEYQSKQFESFEKEFKINNN